MRIQRFFKRIIDVIISIISLILLSPLFLITAILIKIDSSGPIFFRYERIGKDEKPFQPFKFRTMKKGAIKQGLGYNIAEDDERITKVGKFFRKWGIDELPQLINVIKGEMSLVGPRPTLRYQVEKYNNFQRKRLSVKPGITSWALIHGRNLLTWEEKIRYDVEYIQNWNLLLDLKIISRTFYIIFITRKGLYEKNAGLDDEINKF